MRRWRPSGPDALGSENLGASVRTWEPGGRRVGWICDLLSAGPSRDRTPALPPLSLALGVAEGGQGGRKVELSRGAVARPLPTVCTQVDPGASSFLTVRLWVREVTVLNLSFPT